MSRKIRLPSPPKTGWPPGLLQDDCSELSRWFASRIDARETIRRIFRKKDMSLIVYSQPNCPGCVTLKNKYKEEGVVFTEVVIGKDITVDEFKQRFPTVRSVPFVVDSKEETW